MLPSSSSCSTRRNGVFQSLIGVGRPPTVALTATRWTVLLPTSNTPNRTPLSVVGLPLVSVNRPDFLQQYQPSSKTRSEEHTSELQSRGHLVCRLLLEKKKKNI